MTFILIIGGIDLSVGSVLALAASAVSVAILGWGWSVVPAAILGMACAALAGTITGSITVAWRIPSFIVSLGVLEMARGVAYQMTGSRTAMPKPFMCLPDGQSLLQKTFTRAASLPDVQRPSVLAGLG